MKPACFVFTILCVLMGCRQEAHFSADPKKGLAPCQSPSTAPLICSNLRQSKGGLQDTIVGVRVFLLDRMSWDEAGKSCKELGGEMIAGG